MLSCAPGIGKDVKAASGALPGGTGRAGTSAGRKADGETRRLHTTHHLLKTYSEQAGRDRMSVAWGTLRDASAHKL